MENSSNILFSSVKGAPSFVHSPHIPNNIKTNSCSYYLSILDPNIELPELSSKDIDELLSESNFNKYSKDSNNFGIYNSKSSQNPIFNSSLTNINQAKLFNNSSSTVDSNEIKNISNEIISSNDIFNSPYDGMLFKCIVKSCTQNFPNKDAQMQHFYNDHKEKVITCTLCKSIFKSKYSLHNHILMNPACKIKNSYRCVKENCDKYFFSKNNLETHLSQHHNIPSISCLSRSCLMKFLDIKSRNDHVKSEHCEITYYCSKCNKIFLDLHAYEKHNLKLHQESPSRLSYSMKYYVCPIEGCEKYFSTMLNLQQHKLQNHKSNQVMDNYDKLSNSNLRIHPDTVKNIESIKVNVPKDVQILYACPLPECSETLVDKATFQSHFLKHFTGELPGDINSLLPPDPPVPGLELHSKTFEANVDSLYQREETNLVQALDLVPDKLWKSLELLNDEYDSLSPSCGLTSALILPSTESTSNRGLLKSQSTNTTRRRKNPYQTDRNGGEYSDNMGNNSNISAKYASDDIDKSQDIYPKYKNGDVSTSTLSCSLLSSSAGLCSRTCPKINSVMTNLIKRRRVFLKERIGMMESCDSVLYQPEARQPALKQVVRQIFNSQQLPNKYEEFVNVDCSDDV